MNSSGTKTNKRGKSRAAPDEAAFNFSAILTQMQKTSDAIDRALNVLDMPQDERDTIAFNFGRMCAFKRADVIKTMGEELIKDLRKQYKPIAAVAATKIAKAAPDSKSLKPAPAITKKKKGK